MMPRCCPPCFDDARFCQRRYAMLLYAACFADTPPPRRLRRYEPPYAAADVYAMPLFRYASACDALLRHDTPLIRRHACWRPLEYRARAHMLPRCASARARARECARRTMAQRMNTIPAILLAVACYVIRRERCAISRFTMPSRCRLPRPRRYCRLLDCRHDYAVTFFAAMIRFTSHA